MPLTALTFAVCPTVGAGSARGLDAAPEPDLVHLAGELLDRSGRAALDLSADRERVGFAIEVSKRPGDIGVERFFDRE